MLKILSELVSTQVKYFEKKMVSIGLLAEIETEKGNVQKNDKARKKELRAIDSDGLAQRANGRSPLYLLLWRSHLTEKRNVQNMVKRRGRNNRRDDSWNRLMYKVVKG